MDFRPVFRCLSTKVLCLKVSAAALAVAQRNLRSTTAFALKRPEAVREEAKARILQAEGDPECWQLVLSESQLQFGKYRGQTFKWLLRHDVGYACEILVYHMQEREVGDTSQSPLAVNKDALASYARLFPQMMQLIQWRQMCEGFVSVRGMDRTLVGFGAHAGMSLQALYESTSTVCQTYMRWLKAQQCGMGSLMHTVKVYILGREKEGSAAGLSAVATPPPAPPAQQRASRPASSAGSAAQIIELSDDDDLFTAAVEDDTLLSRAGPSVAGSTRPGPNWAGPVGDGPGIEAIYRNEPRGPPVAEEQQQVVEEVVLGPDGHGGYQHAAHLAQALVALRERPYVTQREVREIGALWQKLSDRDKAPISFPPRHQKQQRRAAAQFPDASRLLQAIFLELCGIHQEGRTIAGVRVNRWGVIMTDYRRIRENFFNTWGLSKAAPVQLLEVNQRTLMQWNHKRSKQRMVEIVRQGLQASASHLVASTSASHTIASSSAAHTIASSSAAHAIASSSAAHAIASTSAAHTIASSSAAHTIASSSAAHTIASSSAAHAIASTSAAHTIASSSAAHTIASSSAAHAIASTSAAHTIASSSAAHAIASSSAAHAIASSSAAHAIASSSAAHTIASSSAAHAIASTSAAHTIASSSAAHTIASSSAAHTIASSSAAHTIASSSAAHAIASSSAAHTIASTSAAHTIASSSAAHAVASTSASDAVASTSAAVPKTTAWQRKVREEQERRRAAMGLPTKSWKKREHFICKRCGQPKTREYGHSRYRSQHFCSRAEGRSVEDWLEEKRAEEVAQRQQVSDPIPCTAPDTLPTSLSFVNRVDRLVVCRPPKLPGPLRPPPANREGSKMRAVSNEGPGGKSPQEWLKSRGDVPIPRTTLWRMKKALDRPKEEEGQTKPRTQHKVRACKRYGQPPFKDYSHSQLNLLRGKGEGGDKEGAEVGKAARRGRRSSGKGESSKRRTRNHKRAAQCVCVCFLFRK
ncbi:unnamed protein product [Pleuronectes platessa]|uniref:Uncharacterized protein n=1 Tax=Pleuronectes platessa TaxID=8262 RepID=A0A9N7YXD8_PLEPL|nr:unnamed protein product [Pleuronectes platessa]